MNKVRLASGVSCLFALVACGGSVQSNDPAGADTGSPTADTGVVVEDTGTAPDTAPPSEDTGPGVDAAPLDYGAPSTTFPAFTPDMPQLVTQGDPVLSAPEIVTITYPGEANVAAYEAFGDGLGATSYWKSIVSEYGVGPTKSGPADHVHMTDTPPTSWADSDIDAYISEHATNYAKYGWPAPNDQIIYVLYLPRGTSPSLQGQDACSTGIGGYHTSTNAGEAIVSYAIVIQCGGGGGGGGKPRVATVTASHEIAEAATDPHPESGTRGYMGIDQNHAAWNLMQMAATENGDMCESYFPESRYSDTVDPGFAYNVQRSWSNASVKAGHNPCVPAPTSEPYYNVVALDPVKTTLNAVDYFGTGKQPTMGYHAAVGETITIPIGFWSDAAMPAWNVKVIEGSPFSGSTTRHLSVSIDKTSGQNGQKAYVTVRVNSISSQKASIVTVVSSNGTTTHYMPILVSSQ